MRTFEGPERTWTVPASEPVHSSAVWQYPILLAGFLPLSLWLKPQSPQ